MKTYTKDNCGEKIQLKELRLAEIKMLKSFILFCEKHHLRYYLSGGTLLGAVRHKGFIPWDDDIDINMPRPDCEKLQELSKGYIDEFIVQGPDYKLHNNAESWRLYNPSIIIESDIGGSSTLPYYIPAFIDIFPIEGLPESDKETKKQYKKIILNRKMLNCLSGNPFHGSNLLAKIFHLVMRPFAAMVGYKFWFNRIQKIVQTYKFDDCKYIGVMTAPVHTTEEKMLKEDYIPQIKVMFEGIETNAPANYDFYLTSLYGEDYMKIPSKEKQKSHHSFNIYKYRED